MVGLCGRETAYLMIQEVKRRKGKRRDWISTILLEGIPPMTYITSH
jgi:hypothetical protein